MKKVCVVLLEESLHCIQVNGVTGKTSYAWRSHIPSTKETARRLKLYIFLPRQLPLFISTLSIAISPVNEVPAIPSNVTCKEG